MVKVPAVMAVVATSIVGVAAGPGASVYACVNFQVKPSKPFVVSFSSASGQNKCMNNAGNGAEVTVSDSGSTCAEIGYVEAKTSSSGGDLCATDESIWNISYETKNLPSNKSGAIKTRWRKMWGSQTNEISFYEHAPNTMVCSSSALCYSEKFHWDTGSTGPAYFIFRPDEQNSKSIFEKDERGRLDVAQQVIDNEL